MRIGILEGDRFSQEAMVRLSELGTVDVFDGTDLAAFLAPLDAVFVRLAHRIDDAFLALAPNLAWICSPTTGHNHLDEVALRARGIGLVSLRGERTFLESIRATPEHTFGLILAILRRYSRAFADVSAGRWDRDVCRGEELQGNRVGIIGLGRVGYRVAAYCSAFGAHVTWCDRAEVPHQTEWRRLPDARSVIEASRVVVLCASHRVGEPPILGREEIDRLTGRYLVNTARGELVDEALLLAALREGRPAGIAVDVIAGENEQNRLDEWRALLSVRNLIITPHIAGATFDSMARTEVFIAEKLHRALQQARPCH